jgi:hypothetical protein
VHGFCKAPYSARCTLVMCTCCGKPRLEGKPCLAAIAKEKQRNAHGGSLVPIPLALQCLFCLFSIYVIAESVLLPGTMMPRIMTCPYPLVIFISVLLYIWTCCRGGFRDDVARCSLSFVACCMCSDFGKGKGKATKVEGPSSWKG